MAQVDFCCIVVSTIDVFGVFDGLSSLEQWSKAKWRVGCSERQRGQQMGPGLYGKLKRVTRMSKHLIQERGLLATRSVVAASRSIRSKVSGDLGVQG
jgi:hypothetical protein